MDRKVIAVIILAVVTIAMIAVFIASDSDAKDEKYTISQALRPGDYITYTYEMDGVEGIKEFRITGHDKETGTYSVDDRYVVFTYPKDGSITVKDYFENKTMTGQEITDVVLMTVDTFYKKLQTQVSLNEGVDLTFEKIGQETVDTENFGKIRCSIYEGSYYVPKRDMTISSIAWLGENGIMPMKEDHITTPNGSYVLTSKIYESNLLVPESDNIYKYQLDDSFEVGDYRIMDVIIGGETYKDELSIIAYDASTGMYTVENRYHQLVYDSETGETFAELITETYTWSLQELISDFKPTVEEMERQFYEEVEQLGGIDAEFDKVGEEIVYTDYYGNMNCVRYDGYFYDPEASADILCIYLVSENGLFIGREAVIDYDYDNISKWVLNYSSFIVLVDEPLLKFKMKENLEVGDYYWVDNTKTHQTWSEYDSGLQDFYNLHFKYDISGMTYSYSMYYELDGKWISCDIYEKDGAQVCIARNSGIQLYFEYYRANEVELVKTVTCSANLSEVFTAEDIEAGLTFQKMTTRYHVDYFDGEPLYREVEVKNYYYTVVSVEDDVVDCTLAFEYYDQYAVKNGIASIDGDNIVTERGQNWTTEEFLGKISKDNMVEAFKDYYEVIAEDHYETEAWMVEGVTMANVVHLEGTTDYYECSEYITYMFDDLMLSLSSNTYGDNYTAYQYAYVVDTNLGVLVDED